MLFVRYKYLKGAVVIVIYTTRHGRQEDVTISLWLTLWNTSDRHQKDIQTVF